MPSLIVVDNPGDWPHAIADVEIVAARQYLTDADYISRRNLKVFNLRQYEFETTWTDEEPLAGENRYYVRVEQWDGNMAWASPVWVEYTGK